MRLANERYEEIKRIVAEFFEDYQISSLPINIFEIAIKMEAKIIFASELIRENPNKKLEYSTHKFPNSFTFFTEHDQRFFIYIDDIGTTAKRQRFSLAHEIAHIILNHREQSPQNEAEANFAATYILAPTSLALIVPKKQWESVNTVSRYFNVSKSEAEIIRRRFEKRRSLKQLKERGYEKSINELLKDSVFKKVKDPP